MVGFKPLREIESEAERFLLKYHPTRSLPIPIENILDQQFDLHIVPIPGLQDRIGMDCSLSGDMTRLYLDHDQYLNRYNRARFSLAHEAGHIILHREYLESISWSNEVEWKEVVLGRGDDHNYLETQANLFAGFVLLPSSELGSEFEKEKERLKGHPFFINKDLPEDTLLADFLAKPISNTFEVSEVCAKLRLSNYLKNR